MIEAQSMIQLARQLADCLAADGFPAQHRDLATQILQKLRQPLQVSVIGLPGSGKTSLITMLLGRAGIPPVTGVGLIRVIYGPKPRTVIQHPDGTRATINGLVHDGPEFGSPRSVTFELPIEHLLVQSYAEVTLAGPPDRNAALLHDVATTSDLVIWASDHFTPDEQALWSSVPDHLKDHGFLALTKADQHQITGQLAHRIAALETFVSEEFFGLYPIATLQAIQARSAARLPHPELWSRSGGAALEQAISQHIALGRAEDLDRARALLDEVQINTPQAAPAPVPATPAITNTAQTGRAALAPALSTLNTSAESLLNQITHSENRDFAGIIGHCLTTVQRLSEDLAQAARHDTSLGPLVQDTQEGENLLLLLQLEDNDCAAADAVSLMVQLKKEVSARAYA